MGPALIEPDHTEVSRREGLDDPAAMGPALIEPDHPRWVRGLDSRKGAAMGPALIEPDHSSRRLSRQLILSAAMGPALIEPDHGNDWWQSGTPNFRPQWGRLSSSRITCRKPRRRLTGRSLPQWGRLSSSRITDRSRHVTGNKTMAAMGPALIEPDHRPARRPGRARQAWPQWGRLSSSRITEHRPAGDDR